jgi:hypothetical protein
MTTSASPISEASPVLNPLVRSLCGSLVVGTLVVGGAFADRPVETVRAPAMVPASAETQPAVGTQFVPNPAFSQGADGWEAQGRLVVKDVGVNGTPGARLTSTQTQSVALTTTPRQVAASAVGAVFRAGAWVRTSQLGQRGVLLVREVSAGKVIAVHRAGFRLGDHSWHRVALPVRPSSPDSTLNVRVRADGQREGDRFTVDNVTLRLTAGPAAAGCTFSRRGIPSSACGPLVGAAFNSNTDPTAWERALGRPLGVRRTYWGARHVRDAVQVARTDLAAHRLPWISFKLPHSWADMAAGKGDAWARDLAVRLSQLDGPVWVAFHHEPEGDGRIADWKAMQEHLAPIVRRIAPNVAYTAILMGWYQISGDPRYSLSTVWPDTKIDIAGFDPYNWYGTMKSSGLLDTTHVDMKKAYFDPISTWAASKGLAWAVAETGYTNAAHAVDPTWLPRTLADLRADHGIAMAYFNTPLNSRSTWTWVLGSPGKKVAFARTIAGTPHLP